MENLKEDFKPTLAKPVSNQSVKFDANFKKTMTMTAPTVKLKENTEINEVDMALTEVEQSLKKKIFSLAKMETLVFGDPKLSAVYDEMSVNGEEKYGYHYNETIMNMIFNDYVLNSSKYLQKYKMSIPKEKKRRDKSGINQLKKAGEIKMSQTGLPKEKKSDMDESSEPLTKVLFLVNESDKENPDVFAYFPEITHSDKYKTAYSHIGQHSAIHPNYAKESRLATSEEYRELQLELENLGYNLEVLNGISETTSAGGGMAGGGGANQSGTGAYSTPAAWKSGGDLMEDKVEETTSTAGGGSGAYVGPMAWNKKGDLLGNKGKPIRKPIWQGGKIIQETNYLVEPNGFAKYVNELNEMIDNEKKIDDFIIDKTNAFSSDMIKNWSNSDKNLELHTIKTGKMDTLNLETENVNSNVNMITTIEQLKQMKTSGQKITKNIIPNIAGHALYTIAIQIADGMLPMSWNDLPDINSMWDYIDKNGGMTFESLQLAVKEAVNDRLEVEDINIDDLIKETEQSMITKSSVGTMANIASASDEQGGKVPTGTDQSGGMQNESVISNNMKLLEELNNELNAYSIHHEKLIKMSEDRKIPSEVVRDRVIAQNPTNFKKDLQHSGTKEIIDVEKELQWKDQQTDVPSDPQKLGQDIEKKEMSVSGEGLENVGDSTNDNGKEIPKRNLTSKEQEEVNMYRLGQHSLVYDNEPSKRFEDRMKKDMGDDIYKMRQEQMKFRSKAPMYNKDTQPVENGIKKVQYDKEKSMWNQKDGVNESMITGRYIDILGKRRLIDFTLNDVVMTESSEDYFELDFTGLGNTYNSKSIDNKVSVNESVVSAISKNKFYTDGKTIVAIKNTIQKLNENNVSNKPIVNEQMDKMKHLLGYKPETFTNTNNVKKNRGF